MLHQYQAQNEAMQILGTSEPEILEFCPEAPDTIVLGSGWWGFNTVTEDLPTSTAVNPMLDAPCSVYKKVQISLISLC